MIMSKYFEVNGKISSEFQGQYFVGEGRILQKIRKQHVQIYMP